ncbi:MAG: ROK family protein [FCB group bacterium]|nr:ROK family protein [FCB group bacterium]
MNTVFIGTDVGGTTFSSALFDADLKLLRTSPKGLISDFSTGDELLQGLTKQITILAGGDFRTLQAVGLSCPGPLDAKAGIILETPNLKLFQNYPLARRLKESLEVPVFIENDANLFALGEYRQIGTGAGILAGVTLGTGTGLGLVIDGHCYTGAHGMAAEYGISPVSWGRWEEGISISYLEEQSNLLLGRRLSPAELCDSAAGGAPEALRIWEIYGGRVGLFLAHVINIFDPHRVVIGGGISYAFRYFSEKLMEVLSIHSPAYARFAIPISESRQKDLSSILGAAELAKKGVGNS